MFFTIISFYKQSENQDSINENITLGSYLDNLKLSEYFIKFHIVDSKFVHIHTILNFQCKDELISKMRKYFCIGSFAKVKIMSLYYRKKLLGS